MGPRASHSAPPIDWGQFVPYFQPLVALRSRKLIGFEVLARWNHPTQGLVSPDTFIPMAERDGWIGQLSAQIFRKAFEAGRGLPGHLDLSINVSPLQLRDAALPRQIEQLARQAGFPLDRVIVEITESALARNVKQSREITEHLKALGCRIALDDFGTGYSNLRYLQALAIDELKVDRSFVQSMMEKRESRKIVAAVIGLGQSLGLTTLSEGVEAEQEAEMLSWLGCDFGQGWLYGKPLPAEELPRMVAARREAPKDAGRTPIRLGDLEGVPAHRAAQLKAVYDGAPVGLCFLSKDLKYVNINRRLAEMHGAPAEEHLGRHIAEVLPEIFLQIEPYLQRALHGESSVDVEVTGKAAASTDARTFLGSFQPAWDEAGEVVGISCAVLDFSTRKQMEDRLRQFEYLVEGLEEMVAVVDREYRYIVANRAFLACRGVDLEHLLGRTVAEVLGNDFFERVIRRPLDACFRDQAMHFEASFPHPDGSLRDVELLYRPVKVNGTVQAAACVLRDLTEIKRTRGGERDWSALLNMAERAGLNVGVWDWNVQANTLVFSEDAYRQWGLKPGSFSGSVDEALTRIHPKDRLRVEQALRRVRAGLSRDCAFKYRVVHPDGTVRWNEAQGVLVSDAPPHMIGISMEAPGEFLAREI